MIDDWSGEFVVLVDKVQSLTIREINAGAGCKSQDGEVGIFKRCHAKPHWACTIYSYIFGPHRHHEFIGDTPLEAVRKADSEFSSWVSEYTREYREAKRDE